MSDPTEGLSENMSVQEGYDIDATVEQLTERLMHGTDCARIDLFNTETGHFRYMDKHKDVSSLALSLIQRAGFDIIYVGRRHIDEAHHAPSWTFNDPDPKTYPFDATVGYVEARSREYERELREGER